MEEEKKEGELDLQAILKQAESKTDFPEVTFDEFTPPTDEEWKAACEALLKGAPFDKIMYTKTYEGITFEPMYTHKHTDAILPRDIFGGPMSAVTSENLGGSRSPAMKHSPKKIMNC